MPSCCRRCSPATASLQPLTRTSSGFPCSTTRSPSPPTPRSATTNSLTIKTKIAVKTETLTRSEVICDLKRISIQPGRDGGTKAAGRVSDFAERWQVIMASLGEFNERYVQSRQAEPQSSWLSSLTSMVGSMFVSDETELRIGQVKSVLVSIFVLK